MNTTTKRQPLEVASILAAPWEACGTTVYTVKNGSWRTPVLTTFINARKEPDAMPTDIQQELADRLTAFPAMLAALREVAQAAREVLNNAEDAESNLASSGREFQDLRDLRAGLDLARAAIARAEGGAE